LAAGDEEDFKLGGTFGQGGGGDELKASGGEYWGFGFGDEVDLNVHQARKECVRANEVEGIHSGVKQHGDLLG
jgi:hypothetical protein